VVNWKGKIDLEFMELLKLRYAEKIADLGKTQD
jgi:hypothetical protein